MSENGSKPTVKLDPLFPLLAHNPKEALAYLQEMRRHYLALAANCERMITEIKNAMVRHDEIR